MDYSDALAEMFQDGLDSLWRSINAMPEEKITWKPEPTARTTRELLEELVMTTTFSAGLIRTQKLEDMGEKKEAAPKSLEQLESEHREASKNYLAAVKEFPVDKLHDKITLPWGEMNFLQVIAYPYWNLMYHWGQINYLQTMYGDKEMH